MDTIKNTHNFRLAHTKTTAATRVSSYDMTCHVIVPGMTFYGMIYRDMSQHVRLLNYRINLINQPTNQAYHLYHPRPKYKEQSYISI